MRVEDTIPDDPGSVAVHNKALKEEMDKSKPRDSLLLPLMRSTYHDPRLFIQNDATTVADILDQYPALRRPAVVSHFNYCIAWSFSFILD